MNTYLVGGAVRNRLLGQPVTERDWLVTGSSGDALVQLGFKPVGRDFRVFLHPKTKEEYALPRGEGIAADERELVERDLRLRDLTVNAIAIAADGEIIDPLSGVQDIEARILRHTPGFSQDPMRILRLARLAARLADSGFKIASETTALARRMVADRALAEYSPERVWREIEKALGESQPWIFFEQLRTLSALKPLLPELDRLFGVPQPEAHHPEIDTGIHSLLSLERACELSGNPQVRLAALLHDLGKGTTPREQWPRHIGHELRGARMVEALCRRLRIPNRYLELAVTTARFHTDCHRAWALKPSTVLKRLIKMDAFRRPGRMELLLLACAADLRGRPGFEQMPYPQAEFFRRALCAANQVRGTSSVRPEENGVQTGKRINRARERLIAEVRRQWKSAG
ncbi:MAG: multifunctional CCA addition/repair protein [Gammaproteobacteria bacterium]|nr:multifunctional CCA addition/repair protein [Gammaproteobacteria bacterium]